MLNIIKEKLDLSPDLKKKIDWAKNYTSTPITLKKGHLIRLEPSNLAYVDPHKVIINNYTFLFFNGVNTFYVNNLEVDNKKIKTELEDQKNTNSLLKSLINARNDKHLNLITHLAKGVNSKDSYTSDIYKKVSNKFRQKRLITKDEHRVILRPLFDVSKSEIEQALHHINQEMEEQSEEIFNKRIWINSQEKKDDYYL